MCTAPSKEPGMGWGPNSSECSRAGSSASARPTFRAGSFPSCGGRGWTILNGDRCSAASTCQVLAAPPTPDVTTKGVCRHRPRGDLERGGETLRPHVCYSEVLHTCKVVLKNLTVVSPELSTKPVFVGVQSPPRDSQGLTGELVLPRLQVRTPRHGAARTCLSCGSS